MALVQEDNALQLSICLILGGRVEWRKLGSKNLSTKKGQIYFQAVVKSRK